MKSPNKLHTSGTPTIKGLFINSHVRALKRLRGQAAVRDLENRYGQPLKFRNNQDVPVREEVRLLELAVDLFAGKHISQKDNSFEAGRLHFRNFVTTPFAKIVFSTFRRNLMRLMLNASHIAGHVFRGVKFSSRPLGPSSVRITMENNDYPIDHFRGLFTEWIVYAGYSGSVTAKKIGAGVYEYEMRWRAKKNRSQQL